MFCSTIITTINRPTFPQTLESALAQRWDKTDYEIIVVNDSGSKLNISRWAERRNLTVIDTQKRERSVARNVGAALARGRYLHFLDDDDWLEPDFLRHMGTLAQTMNAGWLYGGSQIVDRQDKTLLQLHHQLSGNCFLQVMGGEWIPLQASLIKREVFEEAGGFNPLLAGPEDIDLLRRIARQHELAECEAIVANIRFGEADSTTDYDNHPQASREARELILRQDKVRDRLLASAHCPEDFGRCLRIFLTSAVWNLKRWRIMAAANRILQGVSVVPAAGLGLATAEYWRALCKPYASHSFARGLKDAITPGTVVVAEGQP